MLIPGGSLGPQGQGKGSNSLHILPPGISCVSLARLILSWVCKSRTGSSGAASFHRSDIDNLLNLNSQPASAHRRKCLTASGRRITHLIPGPAYGCQSLVVKVRKMPSRTTIVQRQWDLGSAGPGKGALVTLSCWLWCPATFCRRAFCLLDRVSSNKLRHFVARQFRE